MAATYSSFMTTRFYSPVFNTALFDGPIRLYFSQSYETVALKIYHLLQTEFTPTWNALKDHANNSKEHLFLIIYPELKDLHMVFTDDKSSLQTQEWEEGLAIGLCQTVDDVMLKDQMQFIVKAVEAWIQKSKQHDLAL
jgi:hypothetical protein